MVIIEISLYIVINYYILLKVLNITLPFIYL